MFARFRADPLERPWAFITAVLIVHGAASLAFTPGAWLVRDEVLYVRQAAAFAQGSGHAPTWDGARGDFVAKPPSPYPPGTSLLMTPFVWAFGPTGARVLPWFASVVLVVATGCLLQFAGLSPLFALLALAYPPTVVLSQLAMSDVPSAALVAVALALFERGARHGRASAWFFAGTVGGASLCLRESNPLVLLPLFAGAVLQRERSAWVLVLGAVLGAALRPLSAALLFGDPWFYKRPGGGFGMAILAANLPMFLFATLCLMPGGLYWVLRFRGPRRVPIVSTVLGFVAFYAAYDYADGPSLLVRHLVLSPRYLIPLAPLFALCAAHAFAVAQARAPGTRSPVRARLPAALVACAGLLAVAVPAVLHGHALRQREIGRAIASQLVPGDLVVANVLAADKLLLGAGRDRVIELRDAPKACAVLERAARFSVVVLDRSDSAFWRAQRRAHDAALRALAARASLAPVLDQTYPGGRRLRIFRANGCNR